MVLLDVDLKGLIFIQLKIYKKGPKTSVVWIDEYRCVHIQYVCFLFQVRLPYLYSPHTTAFFFIAR